jgi:hypothetical protein
MLICAAGDIHGAMNRLFEDVLAFEAALGVCFECVLHVGDLGVWPDPNRIDKATKKHDGAGDFPAWLAERRAAPRKTVFIKGNHEDFVWLDSQNDSEVLPGLFYLRNGRTMELGEGRDVVRVGGVGGCFGPSDFERQSKHLQGYAKRHYTRDEIDTLCKSASVDGGDPLRLSTASQRIPRAKMRITNRHTAAMLLGKGPSNGSAQKRSGSTQGTHRGALAEAADAPSAEGADAADGAFSVGSAHANKNERPE